LKKSILTICTATRTFGFEVTYVRVTMLKEKEAGHSNDCLRAWDMNVTVPPETNCWFCCRNTVNGLFQYMYRASFIILYFDQQMHNYFTNHHTPPCFDTIGSSSGSL